MVVGEARADFDGGGRVGARQRGRYARRGADWGSTRLTAGRGGLDDAGARATHPPCKRATMRAVAARHSCATWGVGSERARARRRCGRASANTASACVTYAVARAAASRQPTGSPPRRSHLVHLPVHGRRALPRRRLGCAPTAVRQRSSAQLRFSPSAQPPPPFLLLHFTCLSRLLRTPPPPRARPTRIFRGGRRRVRERLRRPALTVGTGAQRRRARLARSALKKAAITAKLRAGECLGRKEGRKEGRQTDSGDNGVVLMRRVDRMV